METNGKIGQLETVVGTVSQKVDNLEGNVEELAEEFRETQEENRAQLENM